MIEEKKMAVISTAHLTEETVKCLEFGDDGRVLCYEEGFVLRYIPDEYEDEEWPEDLVRVCKFLKLKGFDALQLDRDADTIGGLPTYTW